MKQRAATTRALRVFLGSCGERSPCLKKHNIYEGIVPFTVCIFFLVLVLFLRGLHGHGHERSPWSWRW